MSARVRFICEWCHLEVSIVDTQKPYEEVFRHFTDCTRRSPLTTDEQVAGLAAHIATIIGDAEQKRMREAG